MRLNADTSHYFSIDYLTARRRFIQAAKTRGGVLHTLEIGRRAMAWLRRVNENNVDLNRNFLTFEGEVPPPSKAYSLMEGLLNPTSPPAADFFYTRASAFLLRYGIRRLKQGVAEGQYAYPKKLFFGGDQLEKGPSLFRALKVLHALREENRFHHFGNGKIVHPAKLRLRETFAPSSTKCRVEVIARGVSCARQVFENAGCSVFR